VEKFQESKNNFYFLYKKNLIKEVLETFDYYSFCNLQIASEWNVSKLSKISSILNIRNEKEGDVKKMRIITRSPNIKFEINSHFLRNRRKIRSVLAFGESRLIRNSNFIFLLEKMDLTDIFKISIGLNEAITKGHHDILFSMKNCQLPIFIASHNYLGPFRELRSHLNYNEHQINIRFQLKDTKNRLIHCVDPIFHLTHTKKEIIYHTLDLLKKINENQLYSSFFDVFSSDMAQNLFLFLILQTKSKKKLERKMLKFSFLFFYGFSLEKLMIKEHTLTEKFSKKEILKGFIDTKLR